jgi:hypothetical protein
MPAADHSIVRPDFLFGAERIPVRKDTLAESRFEAVRKRQVGPVPDGANFESGRNCTGCLRR